jgi:hypothetical protein
MSPGKLISEPSFKLTNIEKLPNEKFNFGAEVTGLDLNNISGKLSLALLLAGDRHANSQGKDADVKSLSDAIWTHKVVVVKGQQNLEPIKQWELVTRFDPNAAQVHSHGDIKTFAKQGGVLSVYASHLIRV